MRRCCLPAHLIRSEMDPSLHTCGEPHRKTWQELWRAPQLDRLRQGDTGTCRAGGLLVGRVPRSEEGPNRVIQPASLLCPTSLISGRASQTYLSTTPLKEWRGAVWPEDCSEDPTYTFFTRNLDKLRWQQMPDCNPDRIWL